MDNTEKDRRAIINNVRKKFPNVDFPEPVIEPLFYGRRKTVPVDNKYIIIDKKSGFQWDVVSSQYGLLYHEESIDTILSSLKDFNEETDVEINMIKNKAVCISTVTFKKEFSILDSPVKPRIKVISSYDKTVQFNIEWGAFELVCENGLVVPLDVNIDAFRHVKGNLEKLPAFTDKLSLFLKDFPNMIDEWNSWNKIKVPENFFEVRKKELPFSNNEVEKILNTPLINCDDKVIAEAPEQDATLWEICSGCTQIVKDIESETRRAFLDKKIAQVLFNWKRLLA